MPDYRIIGGQVVDIEPIVRTMVVSQWLVVLVLMTLIGYRERHSSRVRWMTLGVGLGVVVSILRVVWRGSL